ncbi:MAG: NAD(P)(+) transhydrogenase (Re/Si-specific) subunit alpha [Gemmatimonadetes bacterium]|nr:MAG: NAD(P)(+) transhydrogenase (Re/Si-specific) subunit alpha [Gemmatimonadota bacterium]
MLIGVLRETAPLERRVALVPPSVQKLRSAGHSVLVETGAGEGAYFPDAAYVAAGAELRGRRELLAESEVLLAVQRPPLADLDTLPAGSAVIALLQPAGVGDYVAAAQARGLSLLAMEPQATVAGYQAVLVGASRLARLLPMLTTAAGTIPPGRVLVLGAGVAGLQAIATARRLGGVVSAFDVRPAVKEQVQSLGATFVEAEAVAASAEDEAGYARELAGDQQRKVLEAIGKQLPGADLVITTALIPGKPAPLLITGEMVARMKPGSVIVDLAAEAGGNCELSRAGETVMASGVTILAPVNLPSEIPQHASVMYSRNLQALVEYAAKDGKLRISPEDPITGPMCLTHAGAVPTGR